MIYTRARWADEAHTQVIGWDEEGNSETRRVADPHEFRREKEFLTGFLAGGGVIEDYEAPPTVTPRPQPSLFAAVAVGITDGAISMVEQAAQLQGAIYEDGWLMVFFAQPQDTADYLVFAQSDIPAKIEQYRDTTAFELVFSDTVTGDPINPGRIDIQILKVR